MHRAGALGLVIAGSLLFGGCVAVSDEQVVQADQVGDVEIRTLVCASRPTAVEGCPSGNTGYPAGSGDYQLLVGYRVPRAVRAPESIPSDPAAGADLALAQSPSYTAELERLAPAPPGQTWVGYISPPFAYQAAGGEYRAALLARFQLLSAADGSPYTGPFRHRTVVGYRPQRRDPERAVTCGDSLTTPQQDGVCVDWPAPGDLAGHNEVRVRDVGLVAGPLVHVRRGGTARVPFTFEHNGADGAPSFTMIAGTSAPGATARPQSATFAPPRDSATPFAVSVDVPSAAPPGTYDVTLAARLANGQERVAIARLKVIRAGAGPALALAAPPHPRLEDVLRAGLPIDAACSERCALSAQLRIPRRAARRAGIARSRTVVVGRGRARIATAGRGTIVLELTRAARARLGRLDRVTTYVRVEARNRKGRRTVRTKRVALR